VGAVPGVLVDVGVVGIGSVVGVDVVGVVPVVVVGVLVVGVVEPGVLVVPVVVVAPDVVVVGVLAVGPVVVGPAVGVVLLGWSTVGSVWVCVRPDTVFALSAVLVTLSGFGVAAVVVLAAVEVVLPAPARAAERSARRGAVTSVERGST
jgi:hypothetical protein